MKPAIYWSLRVNTWNGPHVIAVTSEKSKRWYGRVESTGETTHGTKGDLRGRFDKREDAEARRTAIGVVREHYRRQVNKLDHARRRLSHAESQMEEQIISGEATRDSAPLTVTAIIEEMGKPSLMHVYRLVYGEKTIEELEWSGTRRGQGSGPHGSGNDGNKYPACPVCHGLKEPNSEFVSTAVGHAPSCALAAALGLTRHDQPADVGDLCD